MLKLVCKRVDSKTTLAEDILKKIEKVCLIAPAVFQYFQKVYVKSYNVSPIATQVR